MLRSTETLETKDRDISVVHYSESNSSTQSEHVWKTMQKYENDIREEHGEEDAEMMCLLEDYIQVVSIACIKSCMGDFKSSIKMNHTVNAGFICLRRARPSSIIASCLHQRQISQFLSRQQTCQNNDKLWQNSIIYLAQIMQKNVHVRLH